MIKKIVSLLIMLAILISAWVYFSRKKTNSIEYVTFDDSMGLTDNSTLLQRSDFKYVYDVFKDVYEKNSAHVYQPDNLRIPKIIHIMWLGGKMPAEYEAYVASWAKFHPDWTILFWTDNQLNYDKGKEVAHSFDALETRLQKVSGGERIVIDAHNLSYENKQFYDQAINYGEKSDILKWEIVYRFGGVYVDIDFECLQSLESFHHTYDFYTGIQPLDTNMVQLGAALYGAIPHHPILKACVENIKNNQHIKQIVVKTGPIHFTKTFLAFAGKTGLRDIAFPASYFYPCGYEQRGHPKVEWVKNESCAVHHWAGSWLKPEAFIRS